MNVEQKRRELFESGMNKQTCRMNEHGDYVLPSIQDRWSGFNAGLDAVEILLPSIPDPRCGGGDHHYGITQGIKSCHAAIESTGLGLKVKL